MFWTILSFNKLKRYQKSDIKVNGQRYQLVHCYDVSKTSVSFKYQSKRLCDVLSWSVSLWYQLVHCYDVSNWSVAFTYYWHAPKTSQIAPSFWRHSWDGVMMSQHDPGRSNLSLKWIIFFWALGSTFFRHSRYNVSKTTNWCRY